MLILDCKVEVNKIIGLFILEFVCFYSRFSVYHFREPVRREPGCRVARSNQLTVAKI